jgi:uncharacterized membrane protein
VRVLLCGESWVTHSLHIKGVDSFTTSSYVEGADRLRAALGAAGIDVDYLPGHLTPGRFPGTADELASYGAVLLSDIGANSLQLSPDTFERSVIVPDRLRAVERYVHKGGGLLMIGGYLSFAGIEGKARYHGTAVEDALPVVISQNDDRAERPQGVAPSVSLPGHAVLDGVPAEWPVLLGYNQLTAKPDAEVVVRCGADPLLVLGTHGGGRSAAFASDCAPHWCPPAFMSWAGYDRMWGNLLRWLGGSRS